MKLPGSRQTTPPTQKPPQIGPVDVSIRIDIAVRLMNADPEIECGLKIQFWTREYLTIRKRHQNGRARLDNSVPNLEGDRIDWHLGVRPLRVLSSDQRGGTSHKCC